MMGDTPKINDELNSSKRLSRECREEVALDALAGRDVNGRLSPCSSSASNDAMERPHDSNADYK